MIQNVSFQRKVVYLGLIALLMIPLYMIGSPAVGDPSDPDSTPGGKLAQLRTQHDLAQANLGEIDPASESMKLATLGLRGVAAAILWTKANYYKKTENWQALVAVVNQMVKLQPNFVSVWEFQSHNLSYNISVEHDDFRFRYLWVKKGIDILIQGTRYNRREPKLFWDVGWFTGQKMGRADESKQFRRLFADDNDFHRFLEANVEVDRDGRGANGKPDNWLVSRLWYNRAYDLVDRQSAPLRGKSPHIFFADGPKSLMNYAVAVESEGYLDEKAEYAWRRGGQEWREFGDRVVPTSWGERIRLNDREAKELDAKRLVAELEQLLPGAREEVMREKRDQLTEEQRVLYDDPGKIDSEAQWRQFFEAQQAMAVTHREVAAKAPSNIQAKAFRLADRAMAAETSAERIERYRVNVNFEYWRTRCEVEQLPETVKARRHVFNANKLMDEVRLEEAREEFELAWKEWDGILKRNPTLMQSLQAEDLVDEIGRYLELLGQLDEQLPDDFVLKELMELHGTLPDQFQADRSGPVDSDDDDE